MARPGRSAASPALVGRSAELELLVGSLVDPPAIAFVEGEAGIGKSRLVRECLQSPAVADLEVLMVTCPPMTEPFPLGPVVDGLRRLRPRLGELELSPLAGALRPLFPEWADRLPPAPDPSVVRPILSNGLGVLRNQHKIEEVVRKLLPLAESASAATDPALVGLMIAVAALRRKESRGGHFRADFPDKLPASESSTLTLSQALGAAREIAEAERPLRSALS